MYIYSSRTLNKETSPLRQSYLDYTNYNVIIISMYDNIMRFHNINCGSHVVC